MRTQEAIASSVARVVETAHSSLRVILFGSYARGDADAGADLDILVVEQNIPNPVDEYLKLHRAASGQGRGVDLLLMTVEEFEQ